MFPPLRNKSLSNFLWWTFLKYLEVITLWGFGVFSVYRFSGASIWISPDNRVLFWPIGISLFRLTAQNRATPWVRVWGANKAGEIHLESEAHAGSCVLLLFLLHSAHISEVWGFGWLAWSWSSASEGCEHGGRKEFIKLETRGIIRVGVMEWN